MADLGISEFTFGYAFLYEQTSKNWGSVVSIPILPSLYNEKKLGYDAKLPLKGKTFYYQFKTSELLKSSNSKYIKEGPYSGPYYRIKLHRAFNNNQHRILRELSKTEKDTYYVAPECTDIAIFNEAFLDGKVIDHSRLIPLEDCKDYQPTDRKQHYITYQDGQKVFCQFSERNERKESILGKNLKDLYTSRVNDFKKIDEEFSNRIASNVEKLSLDYPANKLFNYESVHNSLVQAEGVYAKLVVSAKILWALHNILMVIIGE